MNEAEKATAIVSEVRKLADDLEDDESVDVRRLVQIFERGHGPVPRRSSLWKTTGLSNQT